MVHPWSSLYSAVRGSIPGPLTVAVIDAVLTRERSMSTGMEHGIAIPHAAVDFIDDIVAVVIRVAREDRLYTSAAVVPEHAGGHCTRFAEHQSHAEAAIAGRLDVGEDPGAITATRSPGLSLR